MKVRVSPNSGSRGKANSVNRKKTIDMVTRLYVHIIQSGHEFTDQEISILYSLLLNLFRYVDVSWEMYVREIVESSYDIDEVLDYLNHHLNHLDKVQIILSLIVMAKKEQDYDISEITHILDLCRSFGLDGDAFIQLISHFEERTFTPVAVPYGQNISSVFGSIFTDYVLFGRDNSCHVRFRQVQVSGFEMFLTSVDNMLFIGTDSTSKVEINSRRLQTNILYLVHDTDQLAIGGVSFDSSILHKIFETREIKDEIVFTKADYDFNVYIVNNRFHLYPRMGTIYQNGRKLRHNLNHKLCYDDLMQIKGYAQFHLTDVIRERGSIEVYSTIPDEAFITFDDGIFSISKLETSNTIAKLEKGENGLEIHPPMRDWSISINNQPVDRIRRIQLNTDIIKINDRCFRLNEFCDLVEVPFDIDKLDVVDIKHYFNNGQLALDSVSSEIRRGELISVMGQSRCGKSTLIK
ncbi:MAG: hypothetical protein FJ042_06545, partial [Candidatus Cloacimonetes bacterium]|nr:hypothetical protein [Candidatus Cloacimonadota bacterium]